MSVTDILINADVLPHQGEEKQLAKIICRSVDVDGRVIGIHSDNPILNTVVYDIEFPDWVIKPYATNIIAENIMRQVDTDEHYSQMLDAIVDHRKDDRAVTKEQKYITTKRGNRKLHQTTVGWQFLVKWKDGTDQWISLKVMK